MLKISDIAQALDANYWGDGAFEVSSLASPSHATQSDLALAMSVQHEEPLKANKNARAAMLHADSDPQTLGLDAAIFVNRSRLALASLTAQFKQDTAATGQHHLVDINEHCEIAQGVTISAFVTIGPNVIIENDVRISSHVHIEAGARIGKGTFIGSGVHIGENVTLGAYNIIRPNAVIGSDGFSFVTEQASHPETGMRHIGKKPFEPMDGTWHKIQSLGGVRTGDHVDIGACSVVDAGTIHPTTVGSGTKIDSHVQVAHNVQVGQDCLLCGHVGIAGSTIIGDRVVLAGQVGVADHVKIGSDIVVAGGGIVLSDIPSGSFMSGHPAQPMQEYRARQKALRTLTKNKAYLSTSRTESLLT